MMERSRSAVLAVVLFAAAVTAGPAAEPPGREPFRGACYCRAQKSLHCAADLTEADCRRRCEDALCDDWFWKERLPCWNWGYGG
jgi:hypothetical protein